jgi:hypothetical protein
MTAFFDKNTPNKEEIDKSMNSEENEKPGIFLKLF